MHIGTITQVNRFFVLCSLDNVCVSTSAHLEEALGIDLI